MKSKKGAIGTLTNVIITLVTIGIILGIGFLVLENFRDQMTSGTEAYSGVNETIVALVTVPTWLGTIVLLAIIGVLLAIVFSVLPRSSGSQV